MIPYSTQWIDDEDIDAVVQALGAERITQGPRVAAFEDRVASYVGARFGVGVANGTAALHAACFAAGIGPGDEVITSTLSFAASANCAAYLGARPVLADIDPETLTLDPADVGQRITPRTRALIPVDFAGHPCAMAELLALARRHDLVVIEDAAHALGAEYRGRRVGSIADMTVFSFHPVKHITTGEGGMVLTDDQALAERLRLFRNHGITRDRHRLEGSEAGEWYYEMQALGFNYRITDIQCALGLAQMARLGQFLGRRREIAAWYREALGSIEELRLPIEAPDVKHAYHLFVIQLQIERLRGGRRAIYEELRARKFGVNVHYIPIHLQPYYRRQFGYRAGDYPRAEAYYERALSVPLYPRMTEEEVGWVARSVREVIADHRPGTG